MEGSGQRNLYIAIAIVLAAILGIALYVASNRGDAVPEAQQANGDAQKDAVPDVSAEISGAAQTPAERLPETNPFSDYKNPFE